MGDRGLSIVFEAALKGLGEEGALCFRDGREREMDAGRLGVVEMQGDEVVAGLHGMDLGPGDHLHAFDGSEEGENFDAERTEDEVGLAGTVQGGADGAPTEGGGENGPCGMRQAGILIPVEGEGNEEDRAGGGHGGSDPERHGLGCACEAEFLVRLGNTHGGSVNDGPPMSNRDWTWGRNRLVISGVGCSFNAMHRLIACLLFLSAIAGMGSRVLIQPFGAESSCVPVETSCDGHDHDHESDHHSDDSHGPDCPATPHHHHSAQCSIGLLVVDDVKHCRLVSLRGQRTQWSHGDEPAPDGPVFSMDKPPLIQAASLVA